MMINKKLLIVFFQKLILYINLINNYSQIGFYMNINGEIHCMYSVYKVYISILRDLNSQNQFHQKY